MPCVNARRCGIFSIFISDVFHPSRYESKRGNKEGKKGKIKGGLKRGGESPRSSKLIHRSTSIRYLPIPRLTGCFGGWEGMKAWMKKPRDRLDRKNGRNMAGPRRRPYNFRPSAARRMFSSMFHPPLYTHAPYTRFLTLSRPQFVCINAQPRDRSTPSGNGKEAEKPGEIPLRGRGCRARIFDACISSPSWFLWTARLSPTARRAKRRLSTGREIVSRRC